VKSENSDYVRLLLFISCFFIQMLCGVAQTPSFSASVSSTTVYENGVFDIRFELAEAEGRNFQPPSFTDFKVVGGPARGSSTVIINGEVSRSESWSYSLLAHKTGKFTIGPASVVAGRNKLTTKPITIEVVEPKDLPTGAVGNTRDDIILIAEVPEQSFYPGQQVPLQYRLLFRENVQTVNVLSEDDYAEFFVQHINRFNKDPHTVRVNGKEYVSRVIKSIALFPHQSGIYTIDPMIMDVGINAPFPGIQGFFTMRRIQDVRITSKPLTITIEPLPANAPSGFNGAVGQYTISATGSNTDLTTDDALTMYVEMTGNGDSKRWDPPAIPTDSLLKAYEPKILEDTYEEQSTGIIHRRRIEYQVLPQRAGQYVITVPFTFFDPEKRIYTTIYSDTLNINVAQGSGLGLHRQARDSSAQQAALMAIHKPLLPDRFWTSWIHLALVGLIAAGSITSVVAARGRRRAAAKRAGGRTTADAVQDAILQLDQLALQDGAMSDKAFFTSCTAIFHRFLCDRFRIPPAELDEARITNYVQQAGIDDGLLQEILALFHESLVVRYGGLPVGFSRTAMMAVYKRVIEASH
jgi:hypothetical protein